MPAPVLSTYRIQLHAGFAFDDAAAVADYLSDLGVTHVYCSPYLQAARGSTHGYDVVNPQQVNGELGGAEGHARFCRALERHGLGQVLDIVPNHMAITGRENAWWWDVLENGRSSRYASYFDVDWDPPEAKLRDKILMPILSDQYGRMLDAGEIRLAREGGSFQVRYREHVLPVAPETLDTILMAAAERRGSDYLGFLADSLGRLQPRVQHRHRDKEVLRSLLAALCGEQPEAAAAIDQVVAEVNANPDALNNLLENQNYRLAYWRTAQRELGYRRFFDVNSMVGLRIEDERVFADSHRLPLEWLSRGVLDGLRIDHPDGLRDPVGYFERLRQAAPRSWIVAEKILMPGERLRSSWRTGGSTGYDFMQRVGGLFIDPAGEEPLTNFYSEFTGEPADFAALRGEKKHQILRDILGSDVNRLTAQFMDVCERNRSHRDYTRHEIHHALREVISCFPVYRTYIQAEIGRLDEDDAQYVGEAIRCAKSARPDLDPRLLDFVEDVLLLRVRGDAETEFVMRFQQLTGPAMAKGVEDTAFYCFNRLMALNEVGGDPGRFGVSLHDFHDACGYWLACWPRTMLATSTHDTKLSEDVRARIALLSEVPAHWSEAVRCWGSRAAAYKQNGFPDRNTEYLLYQVLFGAWPIGWDRLLPYAEKAAREAKKYTSWTDQNAAYEEALRNFVKQLLADRAFVAGLEQFLAPFIEPARVNSLSQTLIKLTAPGVPDLYQGTELWSLNLVDPDNRRPVDYQLRRRLLEEIVRLCPEEIRSRSGEGLPKLWVTRQTLHLRRRRPELFGPEGEYQPLWAEGEKNGHVVAFSRGGGAITVTPRLLMGLRSGWADTVLHLPEGIWRNELTGEAVEGAVPLASLLARFPVALLARG